MPDGDVVLAMGGARLDYLKKNDMVSPKNMSLKRSRTKVFAFKDQQIVTTHDPYVVSLDPPSRPELEWDIARSCRLLTSGSTEPALGTYGYMDAEQFEQAIGFEVALNKGEVAVAAIDLETMGLDPYNPEKRILTLAVSFSVGTSYVYRVPPDGQLPVGVLLALKSLANAKLFKVIGANLKFDVLWMYQKWGVLFENQSFDTFLGGALLDENRGNSLSLHTKVYTDLGGYDEQFEEKHDKAHMEEALESDPEEFLTYAGGDTDACLRVYIPMKKELLKDRALTNFYVKVMQPAAKAFAMMEHRGVCVDLKAYDNLENHMVGEVNKFSQAALNMIPKRLRIKHSDPDGSVKLSKTGMLREFLFSHRGLNLKPNMFTAKGGHPSTAAEHLLSFGDHPEAAEFVKHFGDFTTAAKTMNTYVTGFKKHLRADGKFHPSYQLCRGDFGRGGDDGAVTGRTSCKDPAYQTNPKHTIYAKILRTVYVPPPGHVGMMCDYSQGELRVMATLANCTPMIKAYNEGIDMHSLTGASARGITQEEMAKLEAGEIKKIRQGGKAGNFGLIYKISAEGFVIYAKNSYGVDMSLEDSQNFMAAFFAKYPEIAEYQDSQIEFASANGYVRSPLGRVRHLPLINVNDNKLRSTAERQSINSPTQATLSDLGLLALGLIYERHPEYWAFGFVHDDSQFYLPEDTWEEDTKIIQETMENLPLKELFGWDVPLTFVAEPEMFTTNMSEAEVCSFA